MVKVKVADSLKWPQGRDDSLSIKDPKKPPIEEH